MNWLQSHSYAGYMGASINREDIHILHSLKRTTDLTDAAARTQTSGITRTKKNSPQ